MNVVRKKEKTTVRLCSLPKGESGTFRVPGCPDAFYRIEHDLVEGGCMVVEPKTGKTTTLSGLTTVTPVNPIKQEPETIAWEDRPEERTVIELEGHLFFMAGSMNPLINSITGPDRTVAPDSNDRIAIIEGTFVQKGAKFHQEEEG